MLDYIKKNYIPFTIGLVTVFIFVLSILIVNLFVPSNRKEKVFTEKANSYYIGVDGVKTPFVSTLYKTDTKIVDVKKGNEVIDEDGLLYLADGGIIIPNNYLMIFYTRDNLTYKLEKYTRIADGVEKPIVYSQGKSSTPYNYFLFDTLDNYIFLDDVILKIDKKETKLSRYSFVIARAYDIVVYIYDEDKAYLVPEYKSASIIMGDYAIDLTKDVIVYKGNVKLLGNKMVDVVYKED